VENDYANEMQMKTLDPEMEAAAAAAAAAAGKHRGPHLSI